MRSLRIFISHPSEYLTDHAPHGDGLAAFDFVSRLGARGHEVHVAAPASSVRGALPSSVHLHPIRIRSPLSVFEPFEYSLAVAATFERLHRSAAFDLIHQLNPVNDGLSVFTGVFRVPLVLGLFVGSWQGVSVEEAHRGTRLGRVAARAARPVLDLLDGLQQLRAEKLLVSTPAARSRIRVHALNARKVVPLPFGVDVQSFSAPREERGTGAKVLFVGSLTRRKGVHVLLDAFPSVIARVPEAQLCLAGAGPEEDALRMRASEAGLSSKVIFRGRVGREEMASLFRESTVVCIPSFGEPFGLVALEAMAAGKPVVFTRAGGLQFLIPERGGIGVPAGDSVALGRALSELLASPDVAVRMGATNRAYAESHYDWDRVVDQLERIYADAIGERSA